MVVNVGIVTTAYISNDGGVNDGIVVISSFIHYHLAIGFKHIYIYWDSNDSNDSSDSSNDKIMHNYLNRIQQYYTSKRITIIYRNKRLVSLYQQYCTKYNELLPYMDNEVQARQTLNAELALRLSEKENRVKAVELGIGLYDDDDDDGLHWLLHIDIDEIFYTNDDNINNHFEYLNSMNIDSMTYMNHEGVPELHDTNDYFLTTTLFRRHHFSLPITSTVDSALSYWRNRTRYSQYFLVYDNGKSAVKVNANAIPKDVHRWQSNNNSNFNRKTAIADPRNLCVDDLLVLNDGPYILHYVTCGFRWLTDKYKILGDFPNHWYGGLLPIAPSFHLRSRDVVNKTDIAEEYYRQEIQFSLETFDNDNDLYEQQYRIQLDSQVLMRITKVSDIIKKDREKRCLELGVHVEDKFERQEKDATVISTIASPPNPSTNHSNESVAVAEMDKLRILSQVSQMWF